VTQVTRSPLQPAVRAAALPDDPALARWAALAAWPSVTDDVFATAPVALERDPHGLWLVGRRPELRGRAQVDLVGGRLGARLRRGVGTGDALARAVGARDGRRPPVIDLTMGWARDSAVLATLGCRVHGRERSPVIAALIEDGLARARAEVRLAAALERLTWEHTGRDTQLSFESVFTRIEREAGGPPVLLMDPMFPERDGSALVRLPLRLAGAVVGADPDAPQLLAAALACSTARVVVRRPLRAPELASSRAPDLRVDGGRTTRFDVYLPR